MQDTKFMENVQAFEGMFDQRALLDYVFIVNLYIRIIFHGSFKFSQSLCPIKF